MKKIKLCRLVNVDQSIIFKWRNKKKINRFFEKKKITQDEHCVWFNKKKKQKIFSAWIIKYNKEKIGLIQIDSINDKTCNAGFYIVKEKYFFLTFFVINLLHYKIFIDLELKKIKSFISTDNKKIRKLNKLCGYIEKKKTKTDFIHTELIKTQWLKSFGYKYFKVNHGNI